MGGPRALSFSLGVLLAASSALSACQVGGDPAATVGDAEITTERLEADVVLYRFLAGLSGAPCGSPQVGEDATVACTRFALGNDIREEIVKAYAAEQGISVDDESVVAALGQVSQSLGGQDALRRQLADEGLERADLMSLARRLLLFNEVQSAVTEERLNDDDLRADYEASVQQFTTVAVSHILVESEDQAQTLAERATPRNFADLAAEDSTDSQSAPNGGDLGSYSEAQFRQTFDPTFVEAALSLEPGEISGPVQTQFGWHVIRLVRRDVASFEDVREQLVAQRSTEIFETWLVEQLDELDVEVNPRFGRLDRATGDVVPVRSTEDEVAPSPSPGDGQGAGAATGP